MAPGLIKKAKKSTSRSSHLLPCGRPKPAKKLSAAETTQRLELALKELQDFCLQKKLNRSEAREKILETIILESRHFTATVLLEHLEERYPEIGKATLYRTLPVLVESGLLKEGPHDSTGQILYELSDEEHHDHIVCIDCRQIFEFHDEAIELRQEKISKSLSFTPREHLHVIYANCQFAQS